MYKRQPLRSYTRPSLEEPNGKVSSVSYTHLLFLQGIIDTREKPIDDKMVEWLFKNPIGDGGQFTGISDNLMKYGIVPSGVMVETYSSDNTSRMSNLIGLKLKEYGLELRDAKGSKPEALAKRKTEMLGEIYRMPVSYTHLARSYWTMP